MKKLLKRIIQPRTVIGKVTGAVTSILGLGGGSLVAGLDVEFAIIVALSGAIGYAFSWSKDEVKSFISFLNEESGKR